MKVTKRVVFKIEQGLSDRFDAAAVRMHRSRSNLLEVLIIRMLAERDYIEMYGGDVNGDQVQS